MKVRYPLGFILNYILLKLYLSKNYIDLTNQDLEYWKANANRLDGKKALDILYHVKKTLKLNGN